MCGIIGVLSFNPQKPVSKELIDTMRDTLIHRGPDGAGSWISEDGQVGFGHRRLSILDLSSNAAQPMLNDAKTITITFNGEIYNYQDIKNELVATKKYNWKTHHSDTEVVLHAYEEWGIDAIKRFRGMFSIGIWDKRSETLYLIRDRLGIKPLYYSIYDNKLAFASEIKAILADDKCPRVVNETSLYHYLSFLTVPAPNTLFEGIMKLEAGCILKVNMKGNLTHSRYWDALTFKRDLTSLTENQIISNLRSELRTSVKLHKVSDVPVGVFLSGGIDSTTNTALFAETQELPVETFSIGYEGNYSSYVNELTYARYAADSLGAVYNEKLLKLDDLLDFVKLMVKLQDEPIADPVCVPVYYVSKLARDKNIVVCQVGEGADELFWGYPGWKTSLRLQQLCRLPISKPIISLLLYVLRILHKDSSLPYEWLRRASLSQPIFWGGAESFTDAQKRKILSQRLKTKFSTLTSWDAIKHIYDRFKLIEKKKPNLNWMTYLDLNLRLPELLLMRVDKMTMGVSLEARVPFLDHKLVELAMGIPISLKTKNGDLKYILKKAVKGIIPDRIINRKKQGFGVPIYEWFFDKLGLEIRDQIEEFCLHTDYFDKEELFKLMNKGRGPQMWYIYNFIMWWNEYIKPKNSN
jgi:asparagine synthase (glutamine-hydrolysing)